MLWINKKKLFFFLILSFLLFSHFHYIRCVFFSIVGVAVAATKRTRDNNKLLKMWNRDTINYVLPPAIYQPHLWSLPFWFLVLCSSILWSLFMVSFIQCNQHYRLPLSLLLLGCWHIWHRDSQIRSFIGRK